MRLSFSLLFPPLDRTNFLSRVFVNVNCACVSVVQGPAAAEAPGSLLGKLSLDLQLTRPQGFSHSQLLTPRKLTALFPHHPPTPAPLPFPHIYTGGLRFLSGLSSAFRPHPVCAVSPQTKENLTLSRAPCGTYPAAVGLSVRLSGTAAPPSPFRPLMAERSTLPSLCPTRRYHENSHTTYDLQTGLQANTLCATRVHLLVLSAFRASDVPSTGLHSRWTADTSALPLGLTSVPKITGP